MPTLHDPSTVIRTNGGTYFVYSTGKGIPFFSSADGMNWKREGSVFSQIPERVHAAVPKNNGLDVWAPDIIRVGDTFYLYYAVSSWGSFRSAIALATNRTLDPKDAAYRWVDRGVVVDSDGSEDMNAIDPGVLMAPDGTMWICYGSYHGSIKVLQLDPRTGLALAGEKAKDHAIAIARQSEAADLIFRDKYFYLFVNHGSCCQGKNSEYNIRVGRSLTVTGPYLDKHGVAMTSGGGSLFLAAHDHRIGPGHFGRLIETDHNELADAERFSLHYEADLTNAGKPTLGIRPLLWSADGWPIAGDNLTQGTYQILSQESEDALQVKVGTPELSTARADVPAPTSASANKLRTGRYLALDAQKWRLSPTANGYFTIVNAATGLALGSAEDGSLTMAAADGGDPQMWHLDQSPDGSYRIWNKATKASLSSEERGLVALGNFVKDDKHHWLVVTP